MAAHVAGAVALAIVLAIAGALFTRRVLLLVRLVRMGRPSGIDRTDDAPLRVRDEAVVVLGQRKLLQRLVPGLMHAFIFWGFLVLFPTIVMAMIAAVDKHQGIPWLSRQGWFAFLVDLFVLLVLVGVVAAVVNRAVLRPRRFEGSHVGEAYIILGLISGVVLTLLFWHAS